MRSITGFHHFDINLNGTPVKPFKMLYLGIIAIYSISYQEAHKSSGEIIHSPAIQQNMITNQTQEFTLQFMEIYAFNYEM